MNTTRLDEALEMLKRVRDNKVSFLPKTGICSLCLSLMNEVDIERMFKSWQYFSGSTDYPIPGKDCSIEAALEAYTTLTGSMYDKNTDYGRMRYLLVDHCIHYLEELKIELKQDIKARVEMEIMEYKKKFDKEKALSGAKVVTRRGVEVTGIHTLKNCSTSYSLIGSVNGTLRTWNSEGQYIDKKSESYLDIFMEQ